jgi:hypothetical protein
MEHIAKGALKDTYGLVARIIPSCGHAIYTIEEAAELGLEPTGQKVYVDGFHVGGATVMTPESFEYDEYQ